MKPFQKKITFSSGGYLLKGVLHMPSLIGAPVVIGSHGLLSNGDSPKQIALARQCNKVGLAFFRFDHRGSGQSEGDFYKVTTLQSRCKDLSSAIRLMQERDDIGNRIGLFGSSMGGAACLWTALKFDIEAMVVFAAPVRSGPIVDAAASSDETGPENLRFYEKNLNFDLSEDLEKLHNILVFHGDADKIVPPSDAKEIFLKASKPKKLIMQKGGDHPMNDPAHQKEFIKESAAWFRQFF